MSFNSIAQGTSADADDVQQIIDALTGVSGAGQAIALTQYNSSSAYALDVQNLDTTNSYGLRVRDASSNALILAYKNTLQLGASAANDTMSILANISGKVYIGDSANGNMTTGLTINQGASDNQILCFKSSDVAHGVTDITETDTYGEFGKRSATAGGMYVSGLTETTQGLYLGGTGVTDDTTKSTAGVGYVVIEANTKSGTNQGAPGADANLVAIMAYTTTRFIFDVEGSGHADVAWTTYDKEDDLALVADIESELLAVEDAAQTDRRHHLEQAGIIGKDSWHFENGKQKAMVNMTKLAMLHHGSIMALGRAMYAVCDELGITDRVKARLHGTNVGMIPL